MNIGTELSAYGELSSDIPTKFREFRQTHELSGVRSKKFVCLFFGKIRKCKVVTFFEANTQCSNINEKNRSLFSFISKHMICIVIQIIHDKKNTYDSTRIVYTLRQIYMSTLVKNIITSMYLLHIVKKHCEIFNATKRVISLKNYLSKRKVPGAFFYLLSEGQFFNLKVTRRVSSM